MIIIKTVFSFVQTKTYSAFLQHMIRNFPLQPKFLQRVPNVLPSSENIKSYILQGLTFNISSFVVGYDHAEDLHFCSCFIEIYQIIDYMYTKMYKILHILLCYSQRGRFFFEFYPRI